MPLRLNNSQAMLVDATKAGPLNDDGNPTRIPAARPEWIVMLDPTAMTDELLPYKFDPAYIDNCWAGSGNYDPRQTTVYLKFTTEAEAEAKLARFMVSDA